MKEKIISILKLIGLFLLDQLPTLIAGLIIGINSQRDQGFTWLQTLIVVTLTCAIIYFFVRFARKHQLASFKPDFLSWKRVRTLALGYLACLGFSMLGSMILAATGEMSTFNQDQVTAFTAQMPFAVTFITVAIAAPIMEEIIFRGFVPNILVTSGKRNGLILGTVLFALAHMPTDIGSAVIYLGMGSVLAFVYAKTGRLEMSIGVHMTVNVIAVMAMQFV